MNKSKYWTLFLVLVITTSVFSEVEDEHAGHADDHGSVVPMSVEERDSVGIVVAPVTPRVLHETLRLPGEVSVNAYRSSKVTPRITAQIVKRHVHLGEKVELGQRLVTLSSVEMAEAQGELIVTDQEWKRVKSLGKSSVSERRYTEAQVAQQLALAKVLAYGMTEEQAAELTQSGNASKANGEFDLLALQHGTVLHDDFIIGELIDPGHVLFDLSDESVLWVEAQINPNEMPSVDTVTTVRVSPDGVNWLPGRVLQGHHHVDEVTRTQPLRIEVENEDDSLHPGQFVEVELIVNSETSMLAVPTRSLTMINGVQSVFVLKHDEEFHAEELELGPSVGDWTSVLSGLSEGEEIVIDGVFHLKSVLLKASLGEGHVH